MHRRHLAGAKWWVVRRPPVRGGADDEALPQVIVEKALRARTGSMIAQKT